MQDHQNHRGFSITVTTHDEPAGGSNVTLLVERMFASGGDVRSGAPVPRPEHYHSLLDGPAAVGEAIERTRRAIDEALGGRDPETASL